jgi:hypothetical protein
LSRRDELAATLAAVEQAVERAGDPDDVLRGVVDALRGLYPYAAIVFVEDGELLSGPSRGTAHEPLEKVDVAFGEVKVAELQVCGAGQGETAFLTHIAGLISPHCLVGWDTGGVPWNDD